MLSRNFLTKHLEKYKSRKINLREETNESKSKQERGITLIALIVTIIVLLILSAISIAMLTGNNGFYIRLQMHQQQQLDEQLKLAIMEARLNGLGKIESTESLENALKKNVGEGKYILTETTSGWEIKTIKKDYTLDVDGNLIAEQQEEVSNKKAVSAGVLNSDDAKIQENYFYFAGMNYKFDASVTYDDGSKDSNVIWSVDNPENATIDDNGNLTVLKSGNVKITATSKKDATINKSMNITTYGENGIYGTGNSGGVYNEINNVYHSIHTNSGEFQEIVIPKSIQGEIMTLSCDGTSIELEDNGDYFTSFNGIDVSYCYEGAGGIWLCLQYTVRGEDMMYGTSVYNLTLEGINKSGLESIAFEVTTEGF